jgi:hypothetical protein
MSLSCANCGHALEQLNTKDLRCTECSLHHFSSGEPRGWVVRAGGSGGGILRYHQLLPFRGDEPLWVGDVAHLIRLAAQVGLQDPENIKRIRDQDDSFFEKELELDYAYPKETFAEDWDV